MIGVAFGKRDSRKSRSAAGHRDSLSPSRFSFWTTPRWLSSFSASPRRANAPCGRFRGTARGRARRSAPSRNNWCGRRWSSRSCRSRRPVAAARRNRHRRIFRAVEHQMLEQMRKAGLALGLMLRPDMIPDRHRDDRRLAVGMDDDLQPVGQSEAVIGDLHPATRSATGAAAAGEGDMAGAAKAGTVAVVDRRVATSAIRTNLSLIKALSETRL
jgi:hypothetical protein